MNQKGIEMKKILSLLVFTLCVTSASADVKPIEDTPQNRISEANHYLAVMPPKDMILDMVQKMSLKMVDVEIIYNFVRDQEKRLKIREIDLAKTNKTIDGERPGDYWRRQLQ
jgi:hypothetical protein